MILPVRFKVDEERYFLKISLVVPVESIFPSLTANASEIEKAGSTVYTFAFMIIRSASILGLQFENIIKERFKPKNKIDFILNYCSDLKIHFSYLAGLS
jgi:hypothetical protein